MCFASGRCDAGHLRLTRARAEVRHVARTSARARVSRRCPASQRPLAKHIDESAQNKWYRMQWLRNRSTSARRARRRWRRRRARHPPCPAVNAPAHATIVLCVCTMRLRGKCATFSTRPGTRRSAATHLHGDAPTRRTDLTRPHPGLAHPKRNRRASFEARRSESPMPERVGDQSSSPSRSSA